MIDLRGELAPGQRIVPAVDTSDMNRAWELLQISAEAGAAAAKIGLEAFTAPVPQEGLVIGTTTFGPSEAQEAIEAGDESEEAKSALILGNAAIYSFMAKEAGLDWIADLKLDDIPNTVEAAVANMIALEHIPVGITIHTHSGVKAMTLAQAKASEKGVTMFGVTELTSKKAQELKDEFELLVGNLDIDLGEDYFKELDAERVRKAFVGMRGHQADKADIKALVASGMELKDPIGTDPILAKKITLIPGTRLEDASKDDQANVITPAEAAADGSTLQVHGRYITGSDNPSEAFKTLEVEIARGTEERERRLEELAKG